MLFEIFQKLYQKMCHYCKQPIVGTSYTVEEKNICFEDYQVNYVKAFLVLFTYKFLPLIRSITRRFAQSVICQSKESTTRLTENLFAPKTIRFVLQIIMLLLKYLFLFLGILPKKMHRV